MPGKELFDPRSFLANMGAGRAVMEIRKSRTIYVQDDIADAVFYLHKGRVKLTVLSEQGKEAVVAIAEPGQFFGEGCLAGKPLRLATATTLEDTLVTSIAREAMQAALRDQPAFCELFMNYLLCRNGRIEEDLIDQLFNSSEKRLARLLLLLAAPAGANGTQAITPSLSQETLAEMIGTTRSRVSFFMNKFRRLGMVTYNGRIEVEVARVTAFLHDKPKRGSETAPTDLRS